jgi:hypothetical protein
MEGKMSVELDPSSGESSNLKQGMRNAGSQGEDQIKDMRQKSAVRDILSITQMRKKRCDT